MTSISPNLAAIVVTLTGKIGLNYFLFKKVLKYFFRYRYTCRAMPRKRRIENMVHKAAKCVRFIGGYKMKSLENMLVNFGSNLQNFVETVQEFKNPMRHLDLDEVSAENMNVILTNCNLQRPVTFWIAVPFWKQAYAEKIGEGSFGEVYRTLNFDGDSRIIKFLPIMGDHPDSEQDNLKCGEVIPDLICSKYLSRLRQGAYTKNKAPNFPLLYNIHLVKGKFPEALMRAWFRYSVRTSSERSSQKCQRPDRYDKDQLFVALEFEDCGMDILNSDGLLTDNVVLCAVSICQIIAALAAAETELQFEHRDLHAGNVLFKPTREASLEYLIDGERYSVDTYGYIAYIIDYSMSRITYNGIDYFLPASTTESEEATTEDPDEHWWDHEFIYGKQLEICLPDWNDYHPGTNLLWIRHLIDHLLYLIQRSKKVHILTVDSEQLNALHHMQAWQTEVVRYDTTKNFFHSLLDSQTPYIAADRSKWV